MNKENRYAPIYLNHLGKIFFNYSILGFCAVLLIIVAPLLSVLYVIFPLTLAILIIVSTCGLIFLSNSDFISNLLHAGSHLEGIVSACNAAFPYVFGVTCAVSFAALLMFSLQKQEKQVGKITASSIILGLTIIAGMVFFFVLGG